MGTAHGPADNTGFVDVITAPAATPKMIGNIGAIAIGAGQIEADSEKAKSEALDGRFCGKKKCEVFDQIICANN
ncbi:MAG: hypothetical protein R3D05_04780 [Dongiaceae bacterium]